MKYIKPLDRHQYTMMSSIDDLVASEHPVRILDQIVESIVENNIEKFEKVRTTGAGRPRYHSATMLKLYLYGYFNGISSSRKLEIETHRNKELIWLLGGLKPDHWTISNYRKENSEEIKFVTKKFREFLKKSGYINLKKVAIDGSKVKAYTNRDMLTIKNIDKRLRGIDKKIEEYLTKLSDADQRDEILDEFEDDDNESAGRKYLDKIIALQNQVEELHKQKEKLEKENRTRISPSDPEAKLMKSRDGLLPAYNAQIAVDSKHKMIADSEAVDEENDLSLLPEMIESVKEELGEAPEEAIADKGYYTPDLIESIEKKEEGINLYVAVPKSKKDNEEIIFEYDEDKDEYICEEGQRLVLVQRNKKKHNTLTNAYQCSKCDGCKSREECTTSKKGRMIHRYLNQEWRDQFKTKMGNKIGIQKMLERKALVEHPFGTIRYLMGKIPLLLRGLQKVNTEINLYTTVYNIKRLINISTHEDLIEEISKYQWRTA